MPFQKRHKLNIGNKYHLGYNHSVEARREMSNSHKGMEKPWAGKYVRTKDHKNNIRVSMLGHLVSKEMKIKIGDGNRGRQ